MHSVARTENIHEIMRTPAREAVSILITKAEIFISSRIVSM